MKKIFKASIAAMLAVVPMMAMADPVSGTEQNAAITTNNKPMYQGQAAGSHDSSLATAGYVKGAYNDAIKAVNAVYTEAKSYADSVASAAASDTLDAAKSYADTVAEAAQSAAEEYADTAASSALTSAQAAVSAVESKLSSGATGYDIDANTLKIKGADVATESYVGTAITNATSGFGDIVTHNASEFETAGAAAAALTSAESYADSVASAAESAAKLYADGLTSEMATKEGVVATIKKATVSVANAWGSDSAVDVAISLADNKYYSGLADSTGSAVTSE